MRILGHPVRAGDLVRSRRMPTDPWLYGEVVKIEHGIVTVRFYGRRAEWVASEMPWRAERGCLEFKTPKKQEVS